MNTNNVYCYDSPTMTTLPDDPFAVVGCPTASCCGPSLSSWSSWSAVVLIIVSVLLGWIAGYKWGTSSSSRPSSSSSYVSPESSSSFHKPPPSSSHDDEEDDGGIPRKEGLLGARIGGDVVDDRHDEHDDDRDDHDDDGSMQVLAGAIALFAERCNLLVEHDDVENREEQITSSAGEERTVTSSTKNAHHRNKKKKKVVEYLSPEDMLRTLFPRVPPRAGRRRRAQRGGARGDDDDETEERVVAARPEEHTTVLTRTLRLNDNCDYNDYDDHSETVGATHGDERVLDDCRAHSSLLSELSEPENDLDTPQQESIIHSPIISSPTTSGGRQGLTKQHRTKNNSNVNTFLHLLREIQRHSVDTSHPYFFNQLFGATDPVSLAAELVALSVNTSAYTYETAPVFTLLETEVLGALGRLVFGRRSKTDRGEREGEGEAEGLGSTDEARIGTEYEEEEFDGDGLMLPGGSLSNLTALHVARHHWCLCNGFATTTAAMASCSDGVKECIDDNVESSEETGTFDASDDDSDVEEKKEEENDQHQHQHHRRAPPLPSFPRHHHHSNDASGSELTARSDDDGNSAASATAATRPGGRFRCARVNKVHFPDASKQDLVAFVSSEAHYSFIKSVSVTGIGASNLVVVDTLSDGRMDVAALDRAIRQVKQEGRVPFFVAATAGSTVRGSFDDIEEIVHVCRSHERDLRGTKIWVHVDGAWGGAALFSDRPDMKSSLLRGLHQADSFTVNPHKMLGAPQQTTAFVTRHKRILHSSNGAGAKYLFDPRKNGATYDLGDASYTCGRRTDAIKFWALWKFHGREGLGRLVEEKADALKKFVLAIQRHGAFMLACEPWPFNVCFFYLPPRIRGMLRDHCIRTDGMDGPVLPDYISRELAKVTVRLKLRLHESGQMLLPYQPLSNQKADCFRLVLAGKKCFNESDIQHILCTMDNFGMDL